MIVCLPYVELVVDLAQARKWNTSLLHRMHEHKPSIPSPHWWGTEVDCTIAVMPDTTLLTSGAPITLHLRPDTHASLLKILQDRDVTTQGELCTLRRNGIYYWAADIFAQKLLTALGPHDMAPLLSDTFSLISTHVFSPGADQILLIPWPTCALHCCNADA